MYKASKLSSSRTLS